MTISGPRLVVPMTVMVLLATYAAYAQTLELVGTLVVVDDNEKKMGNVISISDSRSNGDLNFPVVAFKVDNHVFTLRVSQDGFLGDGGGLDTSLGFESTDCSGPPFLILSDSSRLIPRTAVVPPGNTVYIEEPNALIQDILVNSRIRFDGGCLIGSALETVVPAISLLDLFTVFTPPFSVQVEEQSLQLMDLEADLENHSHTYLTGRWKWWFHNNTEVSTSPAEFPE